MAAFGLRHFPKDVGNRLLFCDDRSVARAVSIESICLLSVSQAITHQPLDPQVGGAEGECPGLHGPLQHPVLDSDHADPCHFPWWRDWQVDQHEHHQETRVWVLLCWTEGQDRSLPVYSIAATPRHCVCGARALGQRLRCSHPVQGLPHVHRTNIPCRSSPESRATWSILALLRKSVAFYSNSLIFHIRWALI